MEPKVKIVIDTMGGDNSPGELVKGAALATKAHDDVYIYIVGPEDQLKRELEKYDYQKEQIEIVHAPDAITCHDAPVEAVRKKKESSLIIGMQMVHDGKADAFISAGSTGAVLVAGRLVVGKIKGVERTPLAPLIPTTKGFSLLIDCGANVDARPSHLVQFAKMGSLYMKYVGGVENPKVAIVNVGAEEEKGNALVKETFPLLKECEDINFIGSIESREILNGYADVIVCEAFVGNVILKLIEGVAGTLMKEIKAGMTSTPISTVGAAMVKPALKKTLKRFDATEYGGAPMLGLNGLVAKVHGSATANEVKNAVTQCIEFQKQHMTERMKESLGNKNV